MHPPCLDARSGSGPIIIADTAVIESCADRAGPQLRACAGIHGNAHFLVTTRGSAPGLRKNAASGNSQRAEAISAGHSPNLGRTVAPPVTSDPVCRCAVVARATGPEASRTLEPRRQGISKS